MFCWLLGHLDFWNNIFEHKHGLETCTHWMETHPCSIGRIAHGTVHVHISWVCLVHSPFFLLQVAWKVLKLLSFVTWPIKWPYIWNLQDWASNNINIITWTTKMNWVSHEILMLECRFTLPTLKTIIASLTSINAYVVAKNSRLRTKGASTLSSRPRITKSN